jgi:hypothetical protein
MQYQPFSEHSQHSPRSEIANLEWKLFMNSLSDTVFGSQVGGYNYKELQCVHYINQLKSNKSNWNWINSSF